MKVAIYCRLSEEDRNKQSDTDDSISIQNQKSMLINYAAERTWEIYNIYSDDDYTGADRNRPQFNRLLEDARDHKFDIILCKTQSRFTRELELVEKYIHTLFPQWGIRFVSVVDNADTDVKGNKKSRQINGLINEWYLEDMSENIRSVLTNRRYEGLHIGSFAIYGYLKDPNQKGHLIVDEEAAAVVKEIFTLYAKGYGKGMIAQMLNDRKIPNPSEYKRQKGLLYKQPTSKYGTLWKYSAITYILSNEMYIGHMVQGKFTTISYKSKKCKRLEKESWICVENTHEPIIDAELWEQVQALAQERIRPMKTGKIGLFARKVKCAHCGCTMKSTRSQGRSYLKCRSRIVFKDSCIGSFIAVAALEKEVLTQLHALMDVYLDKNELERKVDFQDNLIEKRDRLTKDADRYKQKFAEYTKGLKDLYMDKVKGVLSESDYLEMSKEFTEEKKRIEKLIDKTQNQIQATEDEFQTGDSKEKIVKLYANADSLNREIVEHLIESIYVSKKDPETEKVNVEIHWNF